jgi:FkbM family methyltransferase
MIKKLANLFGYELLRIKKSHSINSHLKNLFDLYQIDLIIDVGANKGQFGQLIRKLGYKGDILSFEPVLSSFELLKDRAKNDPRWKVFQLGLGDKKDQREINTFKSSDFSSLLAPNAKGKELFDKIREGSKELIEINTLDNILLDLKISKTRKTFLKMDTQGYDMHVFSGAKNSIDSIAALLSEISITQIYDGMTNYHNALMEFERNGYVVSALFPVSHDENDLSVIELDCVMIKKNILNSCNPLK